MRQQCNPRAYGIQGARLLPSRLEENVYEGGLVWGSRRDFALASFRKRLGGNCVLSLG